MELSLICKLITDIPVHLLGVVNSVHFKYYTFYSPCANCASNFLMFQKAIFVYHSCYITIDIVAAAPYKTYWVSCPTCRTQFQRKSMKTIHSMDYHPCRG